MIMYTIYTCIYKLVHISELNYGTSSNDTQTQEKDKVNIGKHFHNIHNKKILICRIQKELLKTNKKGSKPNRIIAYILNMEKWIAKSLRKYFSNTHHLTNYNGNRN